MVVIVKNICDQIARLDPLKKDNISKHRVQTAIKSFTCSYLNVDLKNKTKTQWNLEDRCMILKSRKKTKCCTYQ